MTFAKDRKGARGGHPRGGHIQLNYDVYDSPAFQALDWSAQALWCAMRRKLKGTNNGNIEATIETLRHAGFSSTATLSKGLRALQAVGLVAMTRQGQLSQGSKVCSLYRFTDEAVYEQRELGLPAMKATNEWKALTKLGQARALVKAAHEAAKTGKKREWSVEPKKSRHAMPIQDLNRADSINELRAGFADSHSEAGTVVPIQKLKRAGHA